MCKTNLKDMKLNFIEIIRNSLMMVVAVVIISRV